MNKDQFVKYLEMLDLTILNICETPTAYEANLTNESNPNLSDFTEVRQYPMDGSWFVRLAKVDFFNQSITKDFFKLK